jgi:hypothetical protein
MIIKDIPQTGKLGQTVTWPGRTGLIRRNLVTPKNPRSDSQMVIRTNLAQQARHFDLLTEAQQDAWSTAAAGYQCAPRLGQSGPLTGLQLFTKINCTLALLGQEVVEVPPANPTFPAVAPQNLVVTNAGGVITLKLTCPTPPGENTVIRGSKPQNSGIRAQRDFRVLGTCPAAVQGSADITALYVAKFGTPKAGSRLFIRASVMVSGFESLPRTFTALVPAGA